MIRHKESRRQKKRRVLRRAIEIVFLTLVAFIIGAALAGCPSAMEPAENEVLMSGMAFVPATITIQTGQTVTWRNDDLVAHTATSGSPEDAQVGLAFRSGPMSPGGIFRHRFDEAGTFTYFCELHPATMRGARVIVEAP